MRKVSAVLALLMYGVLGYLCIFIATAYDPASRGYDPPFVLWVLDTINLFIHEAGHFFLRPFGMWMYVFGGSLVQVLLPAMLLLVTWRQKPWQAPLPAFWVGENMVNVSVYISDAPVRQLRLIAGGVIHDWHWLLENHLEAAEPLGTIVFGAGLVTCCTAVGAGIYCTVRALRDESPDPVPE